MGIGNYKHRVTFRTYDILPDGYGGTIDTPVDVLTTWCDDNPLRSSRRLSENQGNLNSVNVFHVRWRRGFIPDSKMRMIVRGHGFVIQGVVELESDHRFWEITATDQMVADEILPT